MQLESTTSNSYPDLDNGTEDKFYKKLGDGEIDIDEETAPTWRVGWLLSAFLALSWYTASNYVAGTQNGDIYAGKIANSLCLGVFAMVYTSFMLRNKDQKFLQAWHTIQSLFVTTTTGDLIQTWDDNWRRETLKAIAASFGCGVLNAIGITALYIAFDDASRNGLNISICTAIVSGNCIYALLASLTVFEDKITLFQTLGVLINLGGVLIISFGQGTSEVTPTMIIGSLVWSSFLGFRIIFSRYCTQRLDSLVFMNINFVAEFLFGVGWILISAMGYFDLTVDLSAQLIVFGGGIFAAGGEIFLFMGIERGVAGAVVSIASTNSIIVGVLHWVIQGAKPSFLQVIAISLTFVGILVMSLGDPILNRIRNNSISQSKKEN